MTLCNQLTISRRKKMDKVPMEDVIKMFLSGKRFAVIYKKDKKVITKY